MGSGSSAIRAFRALRPLRALKRVPGMPKLVNNVLASIPKLGNVMALCAFIFLVFGIVGVQLFQGRMHFRCMDTTDSSDTGEFCAADGPDACGVGTTCHYFEDNLGEGPADFDDIGAASIAILQCASFDAWTTGMYVLMAQYSAVVWVYYVLIVCIGGFFVVNLFLAILLQEFLEQVCAPHTR